VQLALAKVRHAARYLLTLEENDSRRLLEGSALLRRLTRLGLLDEGKQKLDYVLALKIEDFLKRRLQTVIHDAGIAKSIHHARVLIRQRHIRVGKQMVNIPSFMVRVDSQQHIGLVPNSSLQEVGGKLGRCKRKKAKAAKEGKKDE